jgi:hypothetical protein
MKPTLLVTVVVAVLLMAAPAHALLYTFTGEGGLAGSFTLDETTPPTVNPLGTSAIHSSPLNEISGTFGDYAFHGSAGLFVEDLPAVFEEVGRDHWIVRSLITSQPIDGLSLTGLNLFIYRGATATTPFSFVPPTPGTGAVDLAVDFHYAAVFSDDSFVTGALTSLVLVPEPSSLILGIIGLVATLGRRRR